MLAASLHRAFRWMLCLVFLLGAQRASAVILLETGDPTRNTSTPGDNSGWQYEGQFGGFLGTPVAPFYFLTAAHIGDQGTFVFHGETFTTVAHSNDPTGSDLILWQVDHAFSVYAPLFTGDDGPETGHELTVFGRGTQRGAERMLNGELRGWDWGAGDGVERWGRNLVSDLPIYGGQPYLRATFDNPGVADEAHLSGGDSGGGIFVQEGGLWKLAAINYGVDDLYTTPSDTGHIVSAVFDARGFYTKQDDGTFTLIDDPDGPVPTSFVGTRVAARLAWIQGITGQDPTTLPAESFSAWQHLYFTPTQLADATVSGPAADPDGDGVGNLLEFAFNLDPTYPEPAVLTAGTGLRGLPLIRLETTDTGDQRLTVEFVRRTAASGSGLTYTPQFAGGLATTDWQAATGGGAATVVAINARWERVKVTDTVPLTSANQRFARVAVTLAP